MEALKVRVENGKIVGDAPRGLAEGTELELCLAEEQDEMTEEELAALQSALDAGWRSMEAGRYRPATEVITELRTQRWRGESSWSKRRRTCTRLLVAAARTNVRG